jgi:hypothetical protein
LKVFASHVVDAIVSECDVDVEKYISAFEGSLNDLKSSYECIRFLLLSAVRYSVTKDVFSVELQQLGLPKEHSIALGKVFDDKFTIIREYLKRKSLSMNELKGFKISSSEHAIDCMKMELKIDNCVDGNDKVTKEINIQKSDIPILLKELKVIRDKMKEFDYQNQ